MPRRLLGLDFESFYCTKTGYSLRKMDNPSYICDPRFEATMVAVKEGSNPAYPVDGPDIPRFLKDLGDPEDITLYGHNLMFDAAIASWRYGWRAGLNICTLASARQLLAHKLRSLALASVAKYLGLPDKGKFLAQVDGYTRQMIIEAGLWNEYTSYACVDIELAYGILQWALPQLPSKEIVIADSVLRMATEPMLTLDVGALQAHLDEVRAKKEEQLVFAMVAGVQSKADLMSNDKFAEVLTALGVDPPMKISLVTGKPSYAFAKTDDGMRELEEHDDPLVQAVVAARLGHKTTLEETRTARLINIAGLNFPAFGAGLFPVPLKVSGAHTHRLSGDWKLNAQNFKRGGKIRRAITAPDGYAIVAGDESQIEARMSAVFSGQWDLVEQFANKLDPYSIMGTKIFGYPVSKATFAERFIGKQCVLAGMYGVGPPKFAGQIRAKARDEGITLALTTEQAEPIIYTYRRETAQITQMRSTLQGMIPMMTNPDCNVQLGPIVFQYNRILLPSGHFLYYEGLGFDGVGEWTFKYQERYKRLYGGKLLENIIQALARIVVMEVLLRLRKRLKEIGARCVLQCHDELVLCVPLQYVDYAKKILEEELTRPIEWMPQLPLACEVGSGPNYAEAK